MIYDILFYLFLLVAVIGIIVRIIFSLFRRKNKGTHPADDKEWYLQLALSKEDSLSQFFYLLSFFFLGVTLIAFNRDFGDPFSWQTILLAASAIGLAGAYRFKALYVLPFSLIGLTSWWGAQAAEWMQGKDIKSSAIFAGLMFVALFFYSLGHLHEKEIKWKRFSLVYLFLGIISVTAALFFLSTKPGLSSLGDMARGFSFFSSWQMTLSLLLFLAAIVGTALRAINKKLMSPFEFSAVLLLTFLFGAIALLPQQSMFLLYYYSGNQDLSGTGILWAIIFNFVLFFELLGLIFSGYLRQETWLINLGAFFLFLLIIVKYFDWFFTFLDKSVFFIGAGILLFAVGWFMEKGRRYMISNIKTQSQKISQ